MTKTGNVETLWARTVFAPVPVRNAFEVTVERLARSIRLGAGLTAIGWAADGTIEAAQGAGPAWVAGVQWHPEVHDGEELFAGFISVCSEYRDQEAAHSHKASAGVT